MLAFPALTTSYHVLPAKTTSRSLSREVPKALRARLSNKLPALIVSSGFAGGLRPELTTGAVLFSVNGQPELQAALNAAGAQSGRFHCVEKVAATASRKQELWQSTRADAVEMESKIICAVCSERNVPCAVVRVILDTADEDLPLDFSQILNAKEQIHYGKLVLKLMKSPCRLRSLRHLQKQSAAAAEKLANVLHRALLSPITTP